MCGGYGYSSYTPLPLKPSWHKFWSEMKLPNEDMGIFIEIARGCSNVSCKLQCQARSMAKKIMSFEELSNIFDFLNNVKRAEVMLYGMGDVSNYDWSGFVKYRSHKAFLYDTRINISPTTSDENILALAKKGVKIYFNTNTPEEAILANLKVRQLGCRAGSLIVPVVKSVDWLEILKVSTINIEFNSYTPSWSDLYVSPVEFSDGLMSLGIEAKPNIYKLKSGFKPVIESFNTKPLLNNILIMRRCFQLDSAKITIKTNKNNYETWSKKEDDSLFQRLNKFGASKTTCGKCSEEVWYYNFRR